MKAIIDQFEGKYAVVMLEGDKVIDIPKNILPGNVFEGCHLTIEFDDEQSIKSIQIDQEATDEARKRIQEKLDRLRRNEHIKKD